MLLCPCCILINVRVSMVIMSCVCVCLAQIIADEGTDPELRSVAGMAHATMLRIETEAEEVVSHSKKFKLENAAAVQLVKEAGKKVRAWLWVRVVSGRHLCRFLCCPPCSAAGLRSLRFCCHCTIHDSARSSSQALLPPALSYPAVTYCYNCITLVPARTLVLVSGPCTVWH